MIKINITKFTLVLLIFEEINNNTTLSPRILYDFFGVKIYYIRNLNLAYILHGHHQSLKRLVIAIHRALIRHCSHSS